MDAETACLLLGRAGFPTDPEAVGVMTREDRWAVSLPSDRMAWFPMNQAGTRRLAVERRVLDLLAARCSFRAPRVLHADEAGWQVRELVPGLFDPLGLYRRVQADRTLARRIGHALGGILAEQHARVGPKDVAGWLPRRLPWSEPSDRLRDKLPRVVADAGLLRVIARVLRRYEDQEGEAAAGDRVLTHGDLGLHNIALAPDTDEVAGVFDYDGAAWVDRHQDFRYLMFPGAPDEEMLDGALETYEPLVGLRLDRNRIRLCNAACAIGFLGFRCGTPPKTRSCGRSMAEDLQWVTHALQGLSKR
jgi:hypothetical protein